MRYFLLLLLTCSLACQAPSPTGTSSVVTELLVPNSGELPYPVYDSFDAIETLFTQQDDRTYVINFWATWCKPCLEEMPYFEQLAQEADPNTDVITVSLDFKKDIPTKLKAFVAGHPELPPVIALADDKYNTWIDRVDPEWGGAIPVTIIYRNDERIFHAEKFDSYDELKSTVASLR